VVSRPCKSRLPRRPPFLFCNGLKVFFPNDPYDQPTDTVPTEPTGRTGYPYASDPSVRRFRYDPYDQSTDTVPAKPTCHTNYPYASDSSSGGIDQNPYDQPTDTVPTEPTGHTGYPWSARIPTIVPNRSMRNYANRTISARAH
jgi:hypothetical protein